MSRWDPQELKSLVTRFTEAFNQDDLEGVLSFLAEDAIYDEYDGTVHHGRAAIRAAFEPQFRGDYGKIRFETEDLFVDADTGQALIRWRCVIQRDEGKRGWRGLDLLRFEDGRVKEKLTYGKAERLRVEDLE